MQLKYLSINYLFGKKTNRKSGSYAVREITAVTTLDPAYIDITEEHPLERPENSTEQKDFKPDLVMVPFCPESITSSLEEYRRYLKNIASTIPSGGHILMSALKNASFYMVGDTRMEAVAVDEKIVAEALIKLGFVNIQITTIKTGLDAKERGFADNMVIWADKV